MTIEKDKTSRSIGRANSSSAVIKSSTETVEVPRKRAKYESQLSKALEKSKSMTLSLINALYAESVTVKLWKIASQGLGMSEPPTLYPEYTEPGSTSYVYRDLSFWTSGFFPGSLYLLRERQIKYPRFFSVNRQQGRAQIPHPLVLQHLCQWWTCNLSQNANRTDTHDVGFMIATWAKKAWELDRDPRAYSSLLVGANSLASRYDNQVRSLRSWDVCITTRYSFTDPSKDFLVIIDNMMNLDILFWVAKETANRRLYDVAVAHAKTTQRDLVRPDNSTFHVVNYDAVTGDPKEKFTNQGYSDSSCWSRGQAWGILGFAQTFHWTRDVSFLESARSLADYFIAHLPDDKIPNWDFTVPLTKTSPRDTSAAMIAACGMLLIYKALQLERRGCEDPNNVEATFYLTSALEMVQSIVAKYLNRPTFRFQISPPETKVPTWNDHESTSQQEIQQPGAASVVASGQMNDNHSDQKSGDSILNGATINNYEFAPRRWADHGLVYADYYFMLFGNLLLDIGLVTEASLV